MRSSRWAGPRDPSKTTAKDPCGRMKPYLRGRKCGGSPVIQETLTDTLRGALHVVHLQYRKTDLCMEDPSPPAGSYQYLLIKTVAVSEPSTGRWDCVSNQESGLAEKLNPNSLVDWRQELYISQ